jgi:hypothetical protein
MSDFSFKLKDPSAILRVIKFQVVELFSFCSEEVIFTIANFFLQGERISFDGHYQTLKKKSSSQVRGRL